MNNLGLPPLATLLAEGGNPRVEDASYQEPTSKPTPPSNPPPTHSTQSQPLMSFLINSSKAIMQKAQEEGQIYNQLQQNYMQVSNQYQNQLTQLLPSIAMLLAKTPLSSMTDDDLPHQIEQLYTTVPFQVAVENTNKLIKGYYIAKMNGINTQQLDTMDLMQVADNPAFARSTDENLAEFLGRLGAIIQLKMQTALREAGMVKDMYAEKLKEMQMNATIMHNIATALVGMARVGEEQRYHDLEATYLQGKLGIDSVGQQLRNEYLNILAQKDEAESEHWTNEDNYHILQMFEKEQNKNNAGPLSPLPTK
ncbi:TPA: conserved hypothetical protein [Aquificae Joseph's Coat Spring virus]|nr:TPA: conserved hypothetical protein [Aquificae Joseph's Coat Spring virus]